MSKNPSGGRMGFEFNLGKQVSAQPVDDQTPFRLLVMADFSARQSRQVCEPLAGRKPGRIDLDNFDAALAKAGVVVHVPLSGETKMAIPLKRLDDFHPDHLVANLDVFRALKQIKLALGNPATFELAAAQVRAMAGMGDAASPAPAALPAAPSAVSDSEFEQLLGKAPAHVQPPATKQVDISSLVASMVREYVVPHPNPQQQELVNLVNDAMAVQLRAILHDPAFQQTEAAWRGLQFLVSRLELDDQLKLYFLDVSREELMADLAVEDLSKSGLYKLLVEQTVGMQGGMPWSVLIGDYSFGAEPQDVALLARLATIAQAAGAPFLAGARPSVMGCASLGDSPDPDDWKQTVDLDLWEKLRGMDQARYIGLAWPRMMLRLPYGKGGEKIDSFPFEEVAEPFTHESFLWGNPACACGYALADAFREYGWSMQPGGFMEVADLPVYSYKVEGETHTQAPAEAYLTDRASALIQSRGIIPLLSVKGQTAARFAAFSSLAQPAKPLGGPWE